MNAGFSFFLQQFGSECHRSGQMRSSACRNTSCPLGSASAVNLVAEPHGGSTSTVICDRKPHQYMYVVLCLHTAFVSMKRYAVSVALHIRQRPPDVKSDQLILFQLETICHMSRKLSSRRKRREDFFLLRSSPSITFINRNQTSICGLHDAFNKYTDSNGAIEMTD